LYAGAINFGSNGVIAIAAMYGLAAAVASGAVIAAGWRSRRRGGASRPVVPDDPLWGESDPHQGSGPDAEVWRAIQRALARVAPLMTSLAVKVEVAAPFGLRGRMDGAVLADMLAQLLASRARGALGGRLLLTATDQGDRIRVSVTDDGPEVDPAARPDSISGLTETVTRQGGTLDIRPRPEGGTTVTLLFPSAKDRRAGLQGTEGPPAPAEGGTPPWIPALDGPEQAPGG
jgi:hypothetical protein